VKKNLITIAAATGILLMGGVSGAVASGQIGSSDIRNGGIHLADLSPSLKHQLHRDSDGHHTVFVTHFDRVVQAATPADLSGLHMTGEGAYFGPFANGGGCDTAGTDYARLVFNGLNGRRLDQVHQLDYTGWTNSDESTSGVGSLTMRIFTNGPGGGVDNNAGFSKYTYSPNTQPGVDQNADTRGVVKTYLTTLGTWRDNDDAGSDPAGEMPWSQWVSSTNGAERITKIDILLGCQAGTNLQGVVRSIQANGTTYQLGRIG
jgi:hypothetical protein